MMKLSELEDSVRLSLSSLIMMMLVTKDSEDDVDLDQEVAYHVCVASRARRADVWRVYASLVKFSILKFRSVSL